MTSIQKKKGTRTLKTPTDNSLLDAYVDSPSTGDVSNSAAHEGINRIAGQEKRNPHLIDDRQKPITKKNKNRKKREQQRKSQSEGQDSESLDLSTSQDVGEDDVVESWEDIQDVGASGLQPPPPPEFVIDEKAVEERKKKELQEAEILAKKLEAVTISTPENQSKQSKQQNPSGKKKGGKGAGNKKNENVKPSKEANPKDHMNKEISSPPKQNTSMTPGVSHGINIGEITTSLSKLLKTVEDVQLTFKTVPKNSEQSTKNSNVNASNNSSSESSNCQEVKPDNSNIKILDKSKQEIIDAAAVKVTSTIASNGNEAEMSKEDIKAEREAKKQAKLAAKAAAKDKSTCKSNEIQPKKVEQTSVASNTNEESPANKSSGETKSKAELKAERRAKQEAQRAAKASAVVQKSQESDKKQSTVTQSSLESGGRVSSAKPAAPHQSQKVPHDRQVDRASVEKKILKKLASQNIPSRTVAQRKVKLFDHLHQYEREYSISKSFPVVNSHIHPAVLQLGLRYAEGTIQGSNARCLAFMQTMKQLVKDFKLQASNVDSSNDCEGRVRQFSTDLGSVLDTHIAFLKNCRTHSVSMGNAIRLLKTKIQLIGKGTGLDDISEQDIIEERAKQMLFESIDTFVDHVRLAAIQISNTAYNKIKDGDVILTYGCSSLLREVLLDAAKRGRNFKVVVADGRPRFEGREMARHLVQAGIHTTYILVQSVSYIISEITKVFLGAHAVFANGCVMSRVGTSQVALIAKAQNVPVLVCCETYKFSEKVQTDSFVFNELGDPDDLVATGSKTNALEEWRDLSKLCVLNLSYDVTPASLVDAIISEISVIPTTSVPVVLRLKNMDQAVS